MDSSYSKYSGIPVIESGIQNSDIILRGYKTDSFGSLVQSSVFAISSIFVTFMGVLVIDYYEIFHRFAGKSTMIFEDHANLSKVFIIYWHLTTLWFLIIHAKRTSLTTFFLSQSNVDEAEFVLVEVQRQNMVQSTDLGKMVEFAHRIESFFKKFTKSNVSKELVELQHTKSGLIYIEYECVRYIYNSKVAVFEPYKFKFGALNCDVFQTANGLTDGEAINRIELSGPNEILFSQSSFWISVQKEFSGIFYLYQMMTLSIWYFYAYYYMGMLLTVTIIASGIVKVMVSLSAQKKVVEMATFTGYNRVLRNGGWTEIDSNHLVAGDVVEIMANGVPLSADFCILNGDVVVDESSLTGEALPVSKVQVKNDSNPFSKEINAKLNVLFAGTIVLETQCAVKDDKVFAVVLDTGGSTEKGKLVRDILFPVPFVFVFTEHLKIVVPILILWGVILLFASVWMLDAADLGSWFYGMFSISQVLSPVLPAVLVIGQSVSAERLRGKEIVCVDLNRITLAGKVKVFCFDKTGTLTKEGLNFLGVRELETKNNAIVCVPVNSQFENFSTKMKLAMQACHSLSVAQNRFVGNFVDVEMFKSTNANIDRNLSSVIHPEGTHLTIKITRRFEFSHSHAYMSAVCTDNKSEESYIFLKGSYEKILGLVQSSSVPKDFVQQAKKHASEGFYIIAIAGKVIPTKIAEDQNIKREELEKDVDLIGLLLFRNELKEDTPTALAHLREGGCRNVMITGDHQNTALFIAKAAGMLRDNDNGIAPKVIMAELVDKVFYK
jgi:cation-transporting ATPase 13A3/4/5